MFDIWSVWTVDTDTRLFNSKNKFILHELTKCLIFGLIQEFNTIIMITNSNNLHDKTKHERSPSSPFFAYLQKKKSLNLA